MSAKAHPSTHNRTVIIQSVRTPLAFFTLTILVMEVMFGLVASTSSGSDKTYLIFAMMGLVVLLVSVVAFLTNSHTSELLGAVPTVKSGARPRQSWRPALIHHVSLPVHDLPASIAFYGSELGLPQIPPDPLTFGLEVAWFELPGGQQLHLLKNTDAKVPGKIDRESVWAEAHFAIRVGDVRKARERLVKCHKLYVNVNVGFDRYPHFYILDPDGHVVEVNEFPTQS